MASLHSRARQAVATHNRCRTDSVAVDLPRLGPVTRRTAPFASTSGQAQPGLIHLSDTTLVSGATAAPRKRTVCAAAMSDLPKSAHPWPFHENDYYSVELVTEPYGPMQLYEDSKGGAFNGVLVFQRQNHPAPSVEDSSVLEVFVAGDTAFNMWSLLHNRCTSRPMVHDLMWTLMDQARGSDRSSWTLLRVAIVELKDNVFIGRLFFGDAQTGEVKYDCDCRPSDGCYLSLRARCPFYVHRRVWDQACLPLRATSAYKLVASSTSTFRSAPLGTASPNAGPGPSVYSTVYSASSTSGSRSSGESMVADALNDMASLDVTMQDMTQLRPDDPEAIKLLKRQLAVAVSDEDYRQAARLRDHPWMALYRELHTHRLQGRFSDAHRVESDLLRQIQTVTDMQA